MTLTAIAVTVVLLCMSVPAGAEIIDRIAVTVGRQVITVSQIETEVRVTAFLGGQKPAVTDALRREAAARLVDQMLVRREVELTRFPVPNPDEAKPLLEQARAIYNQGYSKALLDAGLNEEDVAQHLLWQLTLMRFVQYRFQPGISIVDSDIREAYNEESAKLRQKGSPTPPFEAMRKDLEAILTQRYVDKALERWLLEQREQVQVVIKVKELE